MKAGTYILALIWGLLIIQPVFAYIGGTPAYDACTPRNPGKAGCAKKTPPVTCSKIKCSSSKEQKKEDCPPKKCNPSLGCTSGNFYIFQYAVISVIILPASKQKICLFDDNRVSKHLTECWHPPESDSSCQTNHLFIHNS